MCKAADEPGGPRRCAAEARTHYQRSAQRVAELEREYDRLTAQLEALTAQRESVVGDIDEQGAVLFEQLTGHRPVTITNTLVTMTNILKQRNVQPRTSFTVL